MIAREGNQRTDTLAVSNGDRQPIVAHIVISRVVKKCLSRWVIPGQFIPVERKNRLSSPSDDRIDSGVLFFEIARACHSTGYVQIALNRFASSLFCEHNGAYAICCTPMLAASAFSVCSRSGPSSPRIVSVSRIAAESMVMLCACAPHDYGRVAPSRASPDCASLAGGDGG